MPDRSYESEQPKNPLAESLPEEDDLTQPGFRPSKRQTGSHRVQFQNDPEVDTILGQFSLERVRGDKFKAEKILRDGLIQHPTAGALHESLGDILAERGNVQDSIASYRRAQSCGGGAAIESKIARIALKQDGLSAGLTGNIVEQGAGPVAMVASALIPGLGLALAGDFRNAGITFGGWLVATALTLLPHVRDVYMSLKDHAITPLPWATFIFIILQLIATAFWGYSLMLTAQVSKTAEKDGS
jgi:hypothetical protein